MIVLKDTTSHITGKTYHHIQQSTGIISNGGQQELLRSSDVMHFLEIAIQTWRISRLVFKYDFAKRNDSSCASKTSILRVAVVAV